jgi:hypothetical protein
MSFPHWLYSFYDLCVRKFAPAPTRSEKRLSPHAVNRLALARMEHLRSLAAKQAEASKANLWWHLQNPLQRLVSAGKYDGGDAQEIRLTLQLLGDKLEQSVRAAYKRWARHYGVNKWLPHDGERQRHRPIPQPKGARRAATA